MTLTFEKIGVNLVVILEELPAAPAVAVDQWGEIFEDPSPQIEAMAPGVVRVLSIRQQAELILQPGRIVIADKSATIPVSDAFPRIASRITKLFSDAGALTKTHGYNVELFFDPLTNRPALDELGIRLLRPEVGAALGSLRCNATLHFSAKGSTRKLQLDSRFSKPDTNVVYGSLNAEYSNSEAPRDEDTARAVIEALVAETQETLRGLFEGAS